MSVQLIVKRSQQGVTLLEVMLVVMTMGVVLAANMVARNIELQRGSASESVFMDSIVVALFNYAKRNNRLPCPDTNGDGQEDATGGVCAPSLHAGGVPYATLEMSGVNLQSNKLARRFVYGVYRGAGETSRDLTRDTERTVPPHVPPHPSYRNLDDFKQALINAQGVSQPVDATNIYVTGNDFNSGQSHCADNRVANMAFLVAFAGERNADGLGGWFDGVHLSSANWSQASGWSGVDTNTCFAGPGKPLSAIDDDQVRAVSFLELIGVLSQ